MPTSQFPWHSLGLHKFRPLQVEKLFGVYAGIIFFSPRKTQSSKHCEICFPIASLGIIHTFSYIARTPLKHWSLVTFQVAFFCTANFRPMLLPHSRSCSFHHPQRSKQDSQPPGKWTTISWLSSWVLGVNTSRSPSSRGVSELRRTKLFEEVCVFSTKHTSVAFVIWRHQRIRSMNQTPRNTRC